jgi:hypothetical protein
LVAAGTHKKRIGTGGEKERKKKEKGLRIDKVRNISSFLTFWNWIVSGFDTAGNRSCLQ